MLTKSIVRLYGHSNALADAESLEVNSALPRHGFHLASHESDENQIVFVGHLAGNGQLCPDSRENPEDRCHCQESRYNSDDGSMVCGTIRGTTLGEAHD